MTEAAAYEWEQCEPLPPSHPNDPDLGGVGDRWVVGPPGTGKTTFLARQIEHDARQRGSANVVAMSHTRAAAAEIAMRGVPLPQSNVGTMHSFAYRALGRPELIETTEHLKRFSDNHPWAPMSATYSVDNMEAMMPSSAEGDNYLAEYSRLRNLQVPRSMWPQNVAHFASAWDAYKRDAGGIDFTDMIEMALADVPCVDGRPEVIIADEAQDLSRLQFALLQKWAGQAEKVVLAYDADQSIYGFSGADPRVFLEHEPRELKVLAQSYRVPRLVHTAALRWIRLAPDRRDHEYRPRPEDGEVSECHARWKAPEPLLRLLERDAELGRTSMILAACGYMLAPVVAMLRDEGVPFHNPYRRKAGQWNPLRRTANGTSTLDRVLSFLAPQRPGAQRIWTGDQLRSWAGLLAGVWKRGWKSVIEDVPAEASEASVLDHLVRGMRSEDDVAAVLDGDLGWLARNAAKGKARQVEYVATVAARGGPEALERDPRVVIGTIHSVKGGEADVVYLFPDLSYRGMQSWLGDDRGAVIRQFYVGMTRAREALRICAPTGSCCVPLHA
jgi:superfamily I DNA/RNA helicase